MPYLLGRCNPVPMVVPGVISNGTIMIATLARARAMEITDMQGDELRLCYIDAGVLAELAQNNGLTRSQQLEQLLPDEPHMRAGDFGEILIRQYLREDVGSPVVPVYRWRNRTHRNDTVRGTDHVGYLIHASGQANPNDVLIMCETKTRSGSVANDVVASAYEGVLKDYASRLANSMLFFQARLIQDGQHQEAKDLARFSNPHKAAYKKRLVAAVAHADNLWNDAFLGALPANHAPATEVQVLILKVEDFPAWIDEVSAAAIARA